MGDGLNGPEEWMVGVALVSPLMRTFTGPKPLPLVPLVSLSADVTGPYLRRRPTARGMKGMVSPALRQVAEGGILWTRWGIEGQMRRTPIRFGKKFPARVPNGLRGA